MSAQNLPDGLTPVDEVDDEDNDLWFAEQPPHGAGGGSDEYALIGDFLPGDDEWSAKTNISADQVAALAVVSMIPELDPEFGEEDVDLAEQFVDHYLKLSTSKEGQSRNQFVKVLQALAGGGAGGDVEGEGPGIIMRGFGAGEDDDG